MVDAFAALSRERRLEPVAYVSFGSQSIGGLGGPAGERPALTAAEAQDVAREIRSAVTRGGAKLLRLDLVEPRRFAFVVQVQTEQPARFLRDHYPEVMEPLDRAHGAHDGSYVEILDGNGDRALLSSWGEWVRPDLASCSPVATYGGPPPPSPPCPVVDGSKTRIVGASTRQRAVLLEGLAGLGSTKIEEIELAKPEPGWSPFDPDAIAFIVRGEESLLTDWHSWLLADAFDERSREEGLPPVLYVASPGGGETRLDGPPGEDELGPSMSATQAGRLADEIAERFTAAGAEVEDVSLLRPRRFAFDIRLRVDDPAELLKELAAPLNVVDPPWKGGHAGMYVEIVDTGGRFVWHGAVAGGHSGEVSAEKPRPDLEGCTVYPFTRPYGYSEPPCPTGRGPRLGAE